MLMIRSSAKKGRRSTSTMPADGTNAARSPRTKTRHNSFQGSCFKCTRGHERETRVFRTAVGVPRVTAISMGAPEIVFAPGATGSARELEPLEAVQRFLDLPPALSASGFAHPGPFLDKQLLPLALGLEIEHRDDLVANQHGLREVA